MQKFMKDNSGSPMTFKTWGKVPQKWNSIGLNVKGRYMFMSKQTSLDGINSSIYIREVGLSVS